MRERILVQLLQENDFVTLKKLGEGLKLSERSIRTLIKEMNNRADIVGAQINNIRGRGYYLSILDKEVFRKWIHQADDSIDIYNADLRENVIIGYLLQQTQYMTMDKLSHRIQVSKSTIIRDLPSVEGKLNELELKLERKKNFGIKITGTENNVRKAISRVMLQTQLYSYFDDELKTITKEVHSKKIKKFVIGLFNRFNIQIGDYALDNLMNHLAILIYRIYRHSELSNPVTYAEVEIAEVFKVISEKIVKGIENAFEIKIPPYEQQLLAVQISSRVSVISGENSEITDVQKEIAEILAILDNEFSTSLNNDHNLSEALTMHMFPLLMRLQTNMQLSNPLIEDINIKYAYAFLLGLRFSQIVKERFGFELSIDETGYITLHLAAHFERERAKKLSKFRRIIAVCTSGGSANLVRIKLEAQFANAIVQTVSQNQLETALSMNPDLIVTTINLMNVDKITIPIIKVNPMMDDDELLNIQHRLSLLDVTDKNETIETKIHSLLDLFDEKYFFKDLSMEYIPAISYMAEQMVYYGDAGDGFKENVLAREHNMTTIYGKGVAGPHPVTPTANNNRIAVAILDKNRTYKGKEVRIIFLMNIKSKDIFLHREISRFLLKLMSTSLLKESVIQADSIDTIRRIINTYL